MEENSAPVEGEEPTPVFAAYRRGYDPDQVDRYVAEQSHRLDEASLRADEAERKLASAVAQMREMHRRIQTLEAIEPAAVSSVVMPTIPLDTLGEHVQRILSESWEGAQALRQDAEQDATDIREKALAEGDRIVASARLKAESVGQEMARRRQAYLEKLETERSRAVSQMEYLQEQRALAIADLNRVKSLVDTTIAEVMGSSQQPAVDAAAATGATASQGVESPQRHSTMTTPRPSSPAPRAEPVLAATMPVHRIAASERQDVPDPSELVRNHRAHPDEGERTGVIRSLPNRDRDGVVHPSIFDFDEQVSEDR
jgi:hypothetical protein